MIHPWHGLSAGSHPPEKVTAVVEIPSGSRNKYELDKESGLFRLDRVLYSAVHYPADYGFIPRTLAEDNDPADILVLLNEPTFPGCQIDARPIGCLRMTDRGEPDDKIRRHPAALSARGRALLSHLQGSGREACADHRLGAGALRDAGDSRVAGSV